MWAFLFTSQNVDKLYFSRQTKGVAQIVNRRFTRAIATCNLQIAKLPQFASCKSPSILQPRCILHPLRKSQDAEERGGCGTYLKMGMRQQPALIPHPWQQAFHTEDWNDDMSATQALPFGAAARPTALNRQEVAALAAAQLADSGVTPAEFDMLGIRCVMPDDPVLRRLRIAQAPGILYSYFLPNNQSNGLQRVRYLRGYEPPDPQRPGKTMRYGHPAGKSEEIYLPPFRPWEKIFVDTAEELYCTEGWLKAIAGCKYLDLNFMAYDGIWNWGKDHRLLPMFNAILFNNRTVYLVNDRDVASNPLSVRAENELARLLLDRGADVRVCRWPASCKYGKLDDAVVLGGKQRRWFDQYVLKPAVVFDVATAQLTEGIPANVTEDQQATILTVSPMPTAAMYGIARRITLKFATPLSLTYPTVLTALSACKLPTTGETRSQLYCALLAGVAGGKSVYLERAETLVKHCTNVMPRLPVSDRWIAEYVAVQRWQRRCSPHADDRR